MIIRISFIVFLLFQCYIVTFGQVDRLFIPYPNLGDTTYYYEVSNPLSIKHTMFDRPPGWFLDESVSPCFIENFAGIQDDKYIWIQGQQEFIFDARQNNLKFISARIKDPFHNQWAKLTLDGNPDVYNDGSSNPNYSNEIYEGHLVYRVEELGVDIRAALQSKAGDKLKVNVSINTTVERVGMTKFIIPFEQVNSMTLKMSKTYVARSFESLVEGQWTKIEGQAQQIIMSQFAPVTQDRLQFMDNGTKRELGSISIDPEKKDNYLGGYYLYKDAFNKLKPCSLDGRGIYLFPNPSYGTFNIKMYGFSTGTYYLKIYNIIGQVLHTQSMYVTGDQNIQIQLDNLPKGTYIYSIENSIGEKIETKRLLILGL